MKNRIKGIIIVRERTSTAPKMHKINAFTLFIIKMAILFIVVTVLAFAAGWTFVVQRIVSYDEMQSQYDSLVRHSQQIDSLKINVVRINRYLQYFKMVSSLDGRNTSPPTIEEYLRDTSLITSYRLDAQLEFRKIPRIRPVTGVISRSFDKSIPHEAVDFAAPQGSPVRVTADGQVESVYYDENLGNVVVVRHSYDDKTLYAN
jgi:murein DD-endopeptidase MepM/ murein hydrolase activator NlpD